MKLDPKFKVGDWIRMSTVVLWVHPEDASPKFGNFLISPKFGKIKKLPNGFIEGEILLTNDGVHFVSRSLNFLSSLHTPMTEFEVILEGLA